MTRYAVPPPHRQVSRIITPLSPESVALTAKPFVVSVGSNTWPSANLAIFVPFVIHDRASFASVRAIIANGAAAAGNWDIGVYDESWSRLASTGAVAMSGTGNIQDLAALVATLAPGRYYLAASSSSGTATVWGYTGYPAGLLAAVGLAQQASAHPLPAVAAPAAYAQTFLPVFGLSSQAVF